MCALARASNLAVEMHLASGNYRGGPADISADFATLTDLSAISILRGLPNNTEGLKR